MNCPACGRKMVLKGSLAECTNILCDYEEEIEYWTIPAERELKLPHFVFE